MIHTKRAVYTYETIVGKEVSVRWWRERQMCGGCSGFTEDVSGTVLSADDVGVVLSGIDGYVQWDCIAELLVTVTTSTPAAVVPRVVGTALSQLDLARSELMANHPAEAIDGRHD